MVKFKACNFYKTYLFMAILATVHNYSICVLSILGPIQLNSHCLFLFRMLKVLQKETKPSSSVPYDKTVEELKQNKLSASCSLECLNLWTMCLLGTSSSHLGWEQMREEPSAQKKKVNLFSVTLHTYLWWWLQGT